MKDYSKPFKVRILEDCRGPDEYGPSGKLDGHYATCLGDYVYPNTWEKSRTEEEGNPLLITNSGDYIWGCECWWDPNPDEHADISLDLMQDAVQLYKANLRKQLGIDPDPSAN